MPDYGCNGYGQPSLPHLFHYTINSVSCTNIIFQASVGVSVGLQYILYNADKKRMQSKCKSVIVKLQHKTMKGTLTLHGYYNTRNEV